MFISEDFISTCLKCGNRCCMWYLTYLIWPQTCQSTVSSTYFVLHSYKQWQTQAFQPSEYEHIADFSPLSSSAVAPCAAVKCGRREHLSNVLKKRSPSGSPQKVPGVLYRKSIWGKNYRFTSRWQQWGERLHSPWCPLTPATDPNGSAGHAQHSRSAPALRHTWWHKKSRCSLNV